MSRIAVYVCTILLAGCDVGALPGFGPDGGGGSADASSSVCENISGSIPSGNHNPGMACQTAACHLVGNTGAGAPEYSYSGTLWKDAAGTIPFPGATILANLGGTERKIIAADNGNFWLGPGQLASPTNAATGTTKASGCPDTTAMVGGLVQGGGNCNNCHAIGGTTAPIHLP